MACACIRIELVDFPTTTNGGSQTCSFNGELTQTGVHNGVPYYEFIALTATSQPINLYLYRDDTGRWGIGNLILSSQNMMWNKYFVGDCPPFALYGTGGDAWEWQGTYPHLLSPSLVCTTSGCATYCCLLITYTYDGVLYENQPLTNNQNNTWSFTIAGDPFEHLLSYNYVGNYWDIYNDQVGEVTCILMGGHQQPTDCPFGAWTSESYLLNVLTIQTSCGTCDYEDRFKKEYPAVTLPSSNIAENIGDKSCCCEQLVLGGSGDTWETDITPVWVKVGDAGSANIVLKKNGVLSSYQPPVLPVVREANAYYAEVEWSQALAYSGAGCYTIELVYNIGGITGTVLWGNYKLMPFSVVNARYTARVSAIFNSYFAIDEIDFTDTNMRGTLRFFGMIGKRQPNTEIDNIIYGNREMKSVVRENLNTYEIETDPLEECVIKPLIDLYLLHENSLFISDYNYHNHSYLYKDLPVILEETAEVTYYDWSRKASVIAKVSDKIKNDMNYYK
jgi:hypothetical protein